MKRNPYSLVFSYGFGKNRLCIYDRSIDLQNKKKRLKNM